MNISIFDEQSCILGEGPLWAHDRLFWVDIKDKKIYARGLQEAQAQCWSFSNRPSALGMSQTSKHILLVAFEKELAFFDVRTGIIHHTVPYNDRAGNRSNDGACGPDGAFWFGTMDDAEQEKTGELFRYDGSNLTLQESKIGISNTVVWSPDGKWMYFADSMEQCIWRYRFDAGKGQIGEKEVFVSLKGTSIYPDGSTIDAHGFLWNAQWDGSRVVRYSPAGEIDKVIELPVSKPTCCAFGGPDFQHLFVTTASIDTSNPLAGKTFVIEDAGQGFAEHKFTGEVL